MKNEPADQVSWSSASSTMPLPARSFSTVSRASASGTRSPGLDAQRAGRLGVLHRRRQPARVLQREPDAQHDVPLGVGLEAAVPVGEGALVVGEGDRLARASRSYATTSVMVDGDLLAVRPDVLDRGGAGRAGDAGQALDAGEPGLHGAGDGVGPHLSGGQFERGPVEFEARGWRCAGRCRRSPCRR